MRFALAVGVAGGDGQLPADIGLGECVGGACRTTDGHCVAIPLPADRAEAIFIGQGVTGGKQLVFGRCATGGDRAGGLVVEVLNHTGGWRGDRFDVGVPIGVGGGYGDRVSNIHLGEGVAGRGRAVDGRATPVPLVGERGSAFNVGERIFSGEGLALGDRCAGVGIVGRVGLWFSKLAWSLV